MELKDAAQWQRAQERNQDPYGHRILTYAEDWANFMEREMALGRKLEDVAKATSHEADTDGIGRFRYVVAVNLLAGAWAHGEALRRWHNLDTPIGTEGERANAEGGVIDPALLSIE